MKTEPNASSITWNYELIVEGYLAHFELDVRCEFESGYRGDKVATVELFHGDDGTEEARFFILEAGREITRYFEEESGALHWEWADACERALDTFRASGAITAPSALAA